MSARPRKVHHVVLLLLIAIVAFLLLMPTRVQPVNWSPPKAPSMKDGPYAENQRLKAVKRTGAQDIAGPEALLLDGKGFLITGLHDGRIIRTASESHILEELTNTHGRPLGLPCTLTGA
jgi:hypothetical protein